MHEIMRKNVMIFDIFDVMMSSIFWYLFTSYVILLFWKYCFRYKDWSIFNVLTRIYKYITTISKEQTLQMFKSILFWQDHKLTYIVCRSAKCIVINLHFLELLNYTCKIVDDIKFKNALDTKFWNEKMEWKIFICSVKLQ